MNRVEEVLKRSLEDEVFPGCSYAVGNERRILKGHLGRHTYEEDSLPISDLSLWDLASLTKILATTACLMKLWQDGKVDLQRKASEWLPRFRHTSVSLQDLLLHESGLPPYEPFHHTTSSAQEAEERLYSLDLTSPPPAPTAYSCLGFMILQRVLETMEGERLDRLARRLIFNPLGMKTAQYLPPPEIRRLCPPTEVIPEWREGPDGPWIQGSVHDPAAWRMGGISGNAGLFAALDDLILFGRELAGITCHVLQPSTVQFFKTQAGPQSTRALGFDTRGYEPSRGAPYWPKTTFGHTGYTGGCLWVSTEAKAFAVLLSNRVHPDDRDQGISVARGAFLAEAWASLDE